MLSYPSSVRALAGLASSLSLLSFPSFSSPSPPSLSHHFNFSSSFRSTRNGYIIGPKPNRRHPSKPHSRPEITSGSRYHGVRALFDRAFAIDVDVAHPDNLFLLERYSEFLCLAREGKEVGGKKKALFRTSRSPLPLSPSPSSVDAEERDTKWKPRVSFFNLPSFVSSSTFSQTSESPRMRRRDRDGEEREGEKEEREREREEREREKEEREREREDRKRETERNEICETFEAAILAAQIQNDRGKEGGIRARFGTFLCKESKRERGNHGKKEREFMMRGRSQLERAVEICVVSKGHDMNVLALITSWLELASLNRRREKGNENNSEDEKRRRADFSFSTLSSFFSFDFNWPERVRFHSKSIPPSLLFQWCCDTLDTMLFMSNPRRYHSTSSSFSSHGEGKKEKERRWKKRDDFHVSSSLPSSFFLYEGDKEMSSRSLLTCGPALPMPPYSISSTLSSSPAPSVTTSTASLSHPFTLSLTRSQSVSFLSQGEKENNNDNHDNHRCERRGKKKRGSSTTKECISWRRRRRQRRRRRKNTDTREKNPRGEIEDNLLRKGREWTGGKRGKGKEDQAFVFLSSVIKHRDREKRKGRDKTETHNKERRGPLQRCASRCYREYASHLLSFQDNYPLEDYTSSLFSTCLSLSLSVSLFSSIDRVCGALDLGDQCVLKLLCGALREDPEDALNHLSIARFLLSLSLSLPFALSTPHSNHTINMTSRNEENDRKRDVLLTNLIRTHLINAYTLDPLNGSILRVMGESLLCFYSKIDTERGEEKWGEARKKERDAGGAGSGDGWVVEAETLLRLAIASNVNDER